MFGMREDHRQKLRKNRTTLLKTVMISENLFSILQESNILTEDMVEAIQNTRNRTKQDQIGALLDTLTRRGPLAYDEFVRALVLTDQDYIADVLDAQAAARYRAERAERMAAYARLTRSTPARLPTYAQPPLPQSVSSIARPPQAQFEDPITEIPKDMLESSLMQVNVQPVDTYSPYIQPLLTFTSNYVMQRSCRGRALIINNEYFIDKRLGTREGANYDVVNLCELLKALQFHTIIKDNVSAKGIVTLLDDERRNQAHSDAFILFIMSHGTRGRVYGIDGESLSIEDDIAARFDGKHCPDLINKPKLFFIQACQGRALSEGLDRPDTIRDDFDAEPVTSIDQEKINRKLKELSLEDNDDSVPSFNRTVHEKADMLLAYSTLPGYKAWRHSELGSWFVRSIVYVFSRYAHEEHLIDLLLRVRQLMGELRTINTDEHYMQITRTSDQLMKKLYFLPGYSVTSV